MKPNNFLSLLLCSILFIPIYSQKKLPDNKKAIIKSIEKHQEELIKISDEIWALAETASKKINLPSYYPIMPKSKDLP